MALAKAQLLATPGGPGIVGATKAGTGLSFAADGTANLLPPTGTAIGGVKAGTNITIAPDGTISGQTGPTNFLPLTGGTLTGRLQLYAGTVSTASVGFTGSDLGTGLYSPRPNYIGMTTSASNIGYWMNDFGQILAGRPEAIPQTYFLGNTTYQAWSDKFTEVGQRNPGSAMFYFGDNNQFVGRLRFCRGEGDIDNIQSIEFGDEIGNLLWCESYPDNPTGIPRAQISCYQSQETNEATRIVFWNTLGPETAMAERWFMGGEGNWVPWTNNSDDLGNPTNKVHDLWIVNPPIVGQSPLFSVSALQEELGLDYVNALEPVAYVNTEEKVIPYREWEIDPSPALLDGKLGPMQYDVVPGTTIHWGFIAGSVVTLNSSLGLQGDLGVAGIAEAPGSEPDVPYIRNEELIAPVVLAIQQLSAQLTQLQTDFDAYVATHP